MRIESDLYQITSYDAWPVVPNSKADWRLLNDWYYNTDPGGQERIKLFVGPVRLSLSWEYYDSSFGECSFNPETGRSWNLEAMLAYDKLFPGAVNGISELNLNKRVLFPNQVRGPSRLVSMFARTQPDAPPRVLWSPRSPHHLGDRCAHSASRQSSRTSGSTALRSRLSTWH